MKVKQFDIPSFENWFYEKDAVYEGVLGSYNCYIRAFSWGTNGVTYKIAASTNWNPLNIYSPTIFDRACHWEWDEFETRDIEYVKNWYNKVVAEFNTLAQEFPHLCRWL